MIAPDNILALLAVMFAAIAASFLLERTRLGSRISAVLLTISFGLVLSNMGFIPHAAPLYDMIGKYLVPLAIPLLLFKADLRRLRTEGGITLIIFSICAAGAITGTLVAAALVDLGPREHTIAGMLTGTYIGGSMNLVAVGEAAQLNDAGLFAAIVAADNIAGTIFLLLLGAYAATGKNASSAALRIEETKQEPLILADIAISLAISAIICALSIAISDSLGRSEVKILIITIVSALLANVAPKQVGGLSGTFEAGMLLFAMFFFTIGAGAEAARLIGATGYILVFAAIIICTSMAITLIAARFTRAGRHEIAIAANAGIAGPATAAAMAASLGRRDLIAPGLLCGVLGYVIATFIGLGMIKLLPILAL
jgi:uncharacterized membrane protein